MLSFLACGRFQWPQFWVIMGSSVSLSKPLSRAKPLRPSSLAWQDGVRSLGVAHHIPWDCPPSGLPLFHLLGRWAHPVWSYKCLPGQADLLHWLQRHGIPLSRGLYGFSLLALMLPLKKAYPSVLWRLALSPELISWSRFLKILVATFSKHKIGIRGLTRW